MDTIIFLFVYNINGIELAQRNHDDTTILYNKYDLVFNCVHDETENLETIYP